MFNKTTAPKQGLTRRDTALCTRMLAVIDQLNELLTDQAELVALDWDADDPFVKDEAKAAILRHTVEFLTQAELDSDDTGLVGTHQLTKAHAWAWFMDDQDEDAAAGIDMRQEAPSSLFEYRLIEIDVAERDEVAMLHRLLNEKGWQPHEQSSAHQPIDKDSFLITTRFTLKRPIAARKERPQVEYHVAQVDHCNVDDDVEELNRLYSEGWQMFMSSSVFVVNPLTQGLHVITDYMLKRPIADDLKQRSA